MTHQTTNGITTRTARMGVLLAAALILIAGSAGTARATIALTNGSFESTGALYNPALGGLYQASGWTNLSGLNIQASSMLGGQELTNPVGVTGTRILRLVSDNPHPGNTGMIVQNMGTMVAGETYTLTGDAFGGGSAGLSWGAMASLVSDGTGSPGTVYATQFVDGLVAGQVSPGAYNFSYTAIAADAGNPLFVQLEAKPSGPGQATRGGIDNVSVTGGAAPPPPALTGLWSVDMQATGASPMSGVESAYGYGNIWNMVESPHWTVITPSKSQALNDSAGTPTSATFSVLTPLSTLNAVGFDTVLTQDFFLFGVGALPNQMDWTISGLTPGAQYEMYNYRAR